MKTTRNDITGDKLVTKTTDKYRDNYDAIFHTAQVTLTEPETPSKGKMCIPEEGGRRVACISYEDFKRYGWDSKYMWFEPKKESKE
jgi:hypothetical protein